jgi:hypothetical protein
LSQLLQFAAEFEDGSEEEESIELTNSTDIPIQLPVAATTINTDIDEEVQKCQLKLRKFC